MTYKFDNSTDFYLEPVCIFALLFGLCLFVIALSNMTLNLNQEENKKVKS